MKIPRRKAKRKVVLESNQDLDQQIDSGSVDFLFLIKNHRSFSRIDSLPPLKEL